MKRIVVLYLACLFLAPVVLSQELNPAAVPAAVRQAFTKNFPLARAVRYGKELNIYKVGFLENNKECYVSYSSAGKWLETEKAMDPSRLPKEIIASVLKNFKGYTIMDAVRREAFDKGVCYEADLMKNQEGYQVRFSEKGDVILKEARRVEFKVETKPKR